MKTQTRCEICGIKKYLVRYHNLWICISCRAKLARTRPLTEKETRACEAFMHLRNERAKELVMSMEAESEEIAENLSTLQRGECTE
jgi:ribosomal protein L37AE/L43A